MNAASEGAELIAKSDFVKAVSAYTQALLQHPTSPDYFIQRSTAFARLTPPRHDLALKDAEFAVLLAQKRAKREKIQAAQQRRVVSLYGLGQYADAKFVLQTMEKWRPKDDKKSKMEGDMWSARIEGKLKTASDDKRDVTVKEYPEVELPSESRMKALLKDQLGPDGNFRFDADANGTGVEGVEDIHTQDATPSIPTTTTTNDTKSTASPVLSKIRHEWYQNTTSVIVTLYAKGVPKDKAEIDIKDDSVYVTFPHPSNSSVDFTFTLDPLFALIDPANSKHNILSTKIELTLQKSIPGQKWSALEGTAPLTIPTSTSTSDTPDPTAKAVIMSSLQNPSQYAISTAPSYPTSSKSGPKNWDKLASDLTAKKKPKGKGKSKSKTTDSASASDNDDADADDVDSDFDSGDAVDSFFKKLYAGADDDTKRAMMKSFQESNGTALSTNWGEVGKRRVDPVESKDD